MKPIGLTEEEIKSANVEELRDAYRELLTENQALRVLISERTCAAVGDLREKGLKFNGNLPYGLESDDETKKLQPSRMEQRLIAEATALYKAGHRLRAIARTLAERDFVNRKGKPLDAKQVSRILHAAGVLKSKSAERG